MGERWWFGSPQAFRQAQLRRWWDRRRDIRNRTIRFMLHFCPCLECITLELSGLRFILIFPLGYTVAGIPWGPNCSTRMAVYFSHQKYSYCTIWFMVSFRQIREDLGEELLPEVERQDKGILNDVIQPDPHLRAGDQLLHCGVTSCRWRESWGCWMGSHSSWHSLGAWGCSGGGAGEGGRSGPF